MNTKNQSIGYISPQDAFDRFQAGSAVIVDVREAGELQDGGTALPALWLATSEIQAKSARMQEFISALPQDKLIVTFCAAGVRSGRFAALLAEKGFQVANMGGFDDWLAARLPVKKV